MRAAMGALLLLSLLATGCSGGGSVGLDSDKGLTASATSGGDGGTVQRGHADPKGSGDPRCDATQAGRSQFERDTNDDGNLNVRKVYLVHEAAASGGEARQQLLCRESDINGDGKKDVIRTYDEDGKPLKEDADRNFDGNIDMVSVFQHGKIVTKELDEDYDGKIDTKVFYESGKAIRTEADLLGKSTAQKWQPTQWRYYEDGGIIRVGTDLDGDTKIDRWERDQTQDATAQAEGEGEGAEGESAEGEDAEGEDAEGEDAEG